MFRLMYADGQLVIQDKARSVIDTALQNSLADHKDWKKANERDENNFDIVDKDGKTLYTVTGPRAERQAEKPADSGGVYLGGEA